MGRGAIRHAARRERRAVRLRRHRHGQARRARAQRRERHRPDALLRDRRRFGRPAAGTPSTHTLHEHFTRVAQRFVATLDDPTDDGVVWRVDLRLRPEGTRGPLVNALAAAERYYETWGRSWERAALVRARPVAGDLALRGAPARGTLGPFVWRRAVDPRIVDEMAAMLGARRAEAGARASVRTTTSRSAAGGIREVEFFAQCLQLVWGGREPRVRGTNTLDALRRLRGRGFVTEREERELSDAYLFLRRTRAPRAVRDRAADAHAAARAPAMRRSHRALARLRRRRRAACASSTRCARGVAARFASLGPASAQPQRDDASFERSGLALDARDEAAVAARRRSASGRGRVGDLPAPPARARAAARQPARRGDARPATRRSPAASSKRSPTPPIPSRRRASSAAFFARLATPGAYVRALADDPRVVRAVCSLLGASVFLGESIVGHPDLLDRVLFARGVPTPDDGARAGRRGVRTPSRTTTGATSTPSSARSAARSGASRSRSASPTSPESSARARWRTSHRARRRDAGPRLSASRWPRARRSEPSSAIAASGAGLAIIALGKFGGREMGYGSDLDIFFVYDAADDEEPERFARIAQRVLRLMETPHGEGAGYSSSTPVCGRRATRGCSSCRSTVSRGTRTSARRAGSARRSSRRAPAPGTPTSGAASSRSPGTPRYERGAPDPARLHHLRTRMEREIGHERLDRSPARYDLKVGRGGLVDVEFAAQWLQMQHGNDPRVRTTETGVALAALETCGYLDSALADTLRDGWRFLRRLEQRLRISHGNEREPARGGSARASPPSRGAWECATPPGPRRPGPPRALHHRHARRPRRLFTCPRPGHRARPKLDPRPPTPLETRLKRSSRSPARLPHRAARVSPSCWGDFGESGIAPPGRSGYLCGGRGAERAKRVEAERPHRTTRVSGTGTSERSESRRSARTGRLGYRERKPTNLV